MVVGSEDGKVVIWDVQSKEVVATWQAHKEAVVATASYPSERIVATAGVESDGGFCMRREGVDQLRRWTRGGGGRDRGDVERHHMDPRVS